MKLFKGLRKMITSEVLDNHGMPMLPDAEKALAVCRDILSSQDGAIADRKYVLDAVRRFGLMYNDWHLLEPFVDWKNSSEFGLIQYPTEFADFVMELARIGLSDGMEIGVWRGASSYFITAILQRANPDFRYHMVDIRDNLVGFSRFASVLNIEKHCPKTSRNFVGRAFDFVLIDADHSYDGAMSDYLNVGRYARKCVAFHDIHAHEYDKESGGIVRAWREVRSVRAMDSRIVEFAHCPTRWMGIGLVVNQD